MVRWMEDAGTSQGYDCDGLDGHRPPLGHMSHLDFQRQLEIEKVG